MRNSVRLPARGSGTIRLGVDVLDYSKELAEETRIPYQKLIDLYLRDCVVPEKRPSLEWVS